MAEINMRNSSTLKPKVPFFVGFTTFVEDTYVTYVILLILEVYEATLRNKIHALNMKVKQTCMCIFTVLSSFPRISSIFFCYTGMN